MHSSFTVQYIQIQQQLERNEIPSLIFRSIAKKNDQKQALRTTPATFICKLHNKRTLNALHELLHTSVQVSYFKCFLILI